MPSTTHYYSGVNGTDVYVVPLGITSRSTEIRTLAPRGDIRGVPPSLVLPFGWGSYNANALELALALFADALDDKRKALALTITFCEHVIARVPADEPWVMSDNVVRAFAGAIAREPLPA